MFSKLFFIIILPLLLSTLVVFNLFSQTSNVGRLAAGGSGKNDDGGDEDDKVVLIAGAVGPESFAFDSRGGGPYTGVSDGRIIKWQESDRRWIDFAVTSPNRDGCGGPQSHDHSKMEHVCGRPLGLCFNETNGDLYIADAYLGLLKVGPEGGLATRVATHAEGVPFGLSNSLDIDPSTGALYFTDSSSLYERRSYLSVILSGDDSGRLMKYDPESRQVTVLLTNLTFPNGVAVSKEGNSILLVETTKCRVLRYWTKTPKAGTVDVFAELPGFPDNIKVSPRGGYWIGMHSRKDKLAKWALSYPWVGKALVKLPFNMVMRAHSTLVKYRGRGMAVRLSEDGEVLEVFEGGKRFRSISEVMEKGGNLWIGSVDLPFAGRYRIQQK